MEGRGLAMAKKRKARELALDTMIRRETRSMAKRRNLPFDVIHEILLCLSVKNLTKFRLVCKKWNSLISHVPFQHEHYRHHQRTPLLLTIDKKDGISTYCNIKRSPHSRGESKIINIKHGLTLVNRFSVTHPAFPCSWTYRIQSCLGLVCVTSMCDHILFVCNPSTGGQVALPPTIESNQCIGFGYTDSTKEFKVAKFYYTLKPIGKTIGCKVFALGSGVWREAKSPPFNTLRVCFGVAPFLRGALHLLHCKRNDYSITAFNIEIEEYRQIPSPKNYYTDDIPNYEPIRKLAELGGLLSLIGKHGNFLELWFLKDYENEKWVKEYSIDFCFVSHRNFRRNQNLVDATPLEIFGDGSVTLALEGTKANILLCYNPQKKIATHKMSYKSHSWGLFVESLETIGGL